MKNKRIATVALSALLLAASAVPCGIFAADGEQTTVYPESLIEEFTFTSLTDFAVKQGETAFAEGTMLYVLKEDVYGDVTPYPYDCGFQIEKLDFDAQGNLYLANAAGEAFAYPEISKPLTEGYEFQTGGTRLEVGDYLYMITGGVLTSYDADNVATEVGEGFTHLKSYDGYAYAIKENCLYKIEGALATGVSTAYVNKELGKSIPYAGLGAAIKEGSTITPATLADGAYCTEVDLNVTDKEFFAVDSSEKTFKQAGVESVLLIATYDNASLIITYGQDGAKACVTLASAVTPTAISLPEKDSTHAYVLTDTKLYSSPYMCKATEKGDVAHGTKITIDEKYFIKIKNSDLEYYKVSYTNESGESVSGYINKNFLSSFSFAAENNEPEEIKGTHDYKTNVEAVILVLVIVGLVIIAIVYLTAVGTKGAKKKQKKAPAPLPPAPDEDDGE